jgi:hypothetical protein
LPAFCLIYKVCTSALLFNHVKKLFLFGINENKIVYAIVGKPNKPFKKVWAHCIMALEQKKGGEICGDQNYFKSSKS